MYNIIQFHMGDEIILISLHNPIQIQTLISSTFNYPSLLVHVMF
jgi:hypothetical protein